MYRWFGLILSLQMIFSVFTSQAAEKTGPFTQRDFGKMIVTQFGWADGLPKEPTDRDYLVVLGGKRNLRYEAENAYNSETDNVTVRNFDRFGPFTGTGWLSGVSEKTYANFTVLVPIGGEYTFKAVIKGQGFVWKIGDKELTGGSPAGGFGEVDMGQISLKPGVLKIKATIPPDGAIDSFTFSAKDFRPIQPFGGWRFSEPLTALRMAEVGVALMGLYEKLPLEAGVQPIKFSAVDVAAPTADASPTTINFLGAFTSRAWLRANFRGASVQMSLKVAKAGYYQVRGRVLGEQISGEINGTAFTASGKPFLQMIDLGIFRLEAGDNTVIVKLPSMGGIDLVELMPRNQSPVVVMPLAGVSGAPERLVQSDEAQKYLKTIREQYPVRK